MKVLAFVILFLFLSATTANVVYGQLTRKIESIAIPFSAANAEYSLREHYSFPSKHIANWILTIENNLHYNEQNPEAKVVLRLKENPKDNDFVEIMMFSPRSYKFSIAVAKEQVGYMRMYESTDAWFPDRAVTLSYLQNDRLSINNGQRTVVDRLNVDAFTLGTIEVYGRDSAEADVNAFAGGIVAEIMSGNPLENPILMIPPILAAVTAGTIITLLVIKKRT